MTADTTTERADLRFGVLAPQVVPYEVQVERWRQLEEYGFDSLWFADHFVNPNMPSGRWFEAYTMMAAAAALTSRLRLGALVTSITFRHPAVFAKEVLTIDHISGGRIEVGIGAAGAPNDYRMTGIGEWPRGERTKRFKEFVLAVEALLTKPEGASFGGDYYRLDDAVATPGPAQQPRPPFTLAANGPVTMRFAARHAESWNQLPGVSGLSSEAPRTAEECLIAVRERNQQMDEFCAAIGRDPRTLRRSVLAGGGVTPDPVWRSEETFRDFVGRYREAGVNEFILYYPSRAEQADGTYERIAREVMPALRAGK